MKVRIVITVDIGDPSKWRRPSPGTGKPWMPDRRPLAVVLNDRLCEAEWGVQEYVGDVLSGTIQPLYEENEYQGGSYSEHVDYTAELNRQEREGSK